MINKLITPGIAILFIVILFCGCTENHFDSEKNKFIGIWKTVETSSDSEVWTFYSNSSIKTVSSHLEEGEEEPFIFTSWSNYQIDAEKLYLMQQGNYSGNPPMYFDYKFSNSNNSLTLSFKGVVAIALNKV